MFPISRRQMLARVGTGLGTLGLATVLEQQGLLAANPLAAKKPHHAPKAKHIIHLFMNGGPSQVDTFDPKPELTKYNGQKMPQEVKTERRVGNLMQSPFTFKKYGKAGIEVSELYPHVGGVHRRHLRDPLDAHERTEPRAVAAHDDLRRPAAGATVDGLVAALRTRLG